jgi:hypothetical protein
VTAKRSIFTTFQVYSWEKEWERETRRSGETELEEGRTYGLSERKGGTVIEEEGGR